MIRSQERQVNFSRAVCISPISVNRPEDGRCPPHLAWDRDQRIEEAAQRHVDRAARDGRQHAACAAHQDGEEGGRSRDPDRVARPEQDPAQHIAAEIVAAERQRPAHRPEQIVVDERTDVMRGDIGADDRHQHPEGDDG